MVAVPGPDDPRQDHPGGAQPPRRVLTRRLAAAVAVALLAWILIVAIEDRRGPDAKSLPGPPLKSLASPRYVGTAVDGLALDREPGYRTVLAEEFSSVTPENAMKWGVIEPQPGKFAWGDADAIVDFARDHGQRVRGHTLVWHSQNPAWLEGLEGGALRRAIREHIGAVVGRYRGRVGDWDVVNEPLRDDGTLRPQRYMRKELIAAAFRWAHDVDPRARLWLNEIGAEEIGPKSDALYALVRELRTAGVPVDGVGFQGHFSLKGVPPTFRQNVARFAALGVRVALTELDVAVPLPESDAERARQAAIYRQAIADCAACVGVTVWGFTDRHSWIPSNQQGMGAATLLDGDLRAKPAYTALASALRR
ncbi:MAG TPA: endo-1,4-beta-xylanase [Solirubrobacteraceae bacterium]